METRKHQMKTTDKERHLRRFNGIKKIRCFFEEKGFLETPTPPMVENPGMETHIHPFQVNSVFNQFDNHSFLQTSPEFAMKELLSLGFENIFNLSYCFRDEPKSETHRAQFLMLEWYRAGANHFDILKDSEDLLTYFSPEMPIVKQTVAELFFTYLDLDILAVDSKEKLVEWIKTNKDKTRIGNQDLKPLTWDDLFFLLWLNDIEPNFKKIPALFVLNYPASMAALSTINKENPKVCERFEMYLYGTEVANCFNELTHASEQKERFKNQSLEKNELYGYELPQPTSFYKSLERGLPKSAGIALGVERFLGAISKSEIPFWD